MAVIGRSMPPIGRLLGSCSRYISVHARRLLVGLRVYVFMCIL
jgi:hypothetical protein